MDRKENNIGSDTIVFSIKNSKDSEMKRILTTVYDALVEKGYDPLNQIVGYILSEDPGYITNHKNARIDRDELLETLVKEYLEN